MAKQYHFVLMVDSDGTNLDIDWDTTQVMLEEHGGTIFDTDIQEWEPGFGEEEYEAIADKLARFIRGVTL